MHLLSLIVLCAAMYTISAPIPDNEPHSLEELSTGSNPDAMPSRELTHDSRDRHHVQTPSSPHFASHHHVNRLETRAKIPTAVLKAEARLAKKAASPARKAVGSTKVPHKKATPAAATKPRVASAQKAGVAAGGTTKSTDGRGAIAKKAGSKLPAKKAATAAAGRAASPKGAKKSTGSVKKAGAAGKLKKSAATGSKKAGLTGKPKKPITGLKKAGLTGKSTKATGGTKKTVLAPKNSKFKVPKTPVGQAGKKHDSRVGAIRPGASNKARGYSQGKTSSSVRKPGMKTPSNREGSSSFLGTQPTGKTHSAAPGSAPNHSTGTRSGVQSSSSNTGGQGGSNQSGQGSSGGGSNSGGNGDGRQPHAGGNHPAGSRPPKLQSSVRSKTSSSSRGSRPPSRQSSVNIQSSGSSGNAVHASVAAGSLPGAQVGPATQQPGLQAPRPPHRQRPYLINRLLNPMRTSTPPLYSARDPPPSYSEKPKPGEIILAASKLVPRPGTSSNVGIHPNEKQHSDWKSKGEGSNSDGNGNRERLPTVGNGPEAAPAPQQPQQQSGSQAPPPPHRQRPNFVNRILTPIRNMMRGQQPSPVSTFQDAVRQAIHPNNLPNAASGSNPPPYNPPAYSES